jgi:hypothetical protein
MATIQGDLAEYSVPDLVQFIHGSRKRGQLVLESPSRTPAGVWFTEGDVVHAWSPPRAGVQAFFEVLGWQEGRFAFLKNAAAPQRTIHDDVQNLLLEGLRRLDEFRRFEAHLPSPATVLHLAPERDGPEDVRLTRLEWQVLSQVNGRRTLEEVMRRSGRADHEAARVVYGLLVAGLVATAGDDAWLDEIVPERIPALEAAAQRSAPPTLAANLLLKQADGRRPLRAILGALSLPEREALEELRLLVRTGWIRFVRGRDAFERHVAG